MMNRFDDYGDKRCTNLLQAMELGDFGRDEVLDRLNNLKQLRCEDEAKLSGLLKTMSVQP